MIKKLVRITIIGFLVLVVLIGTLVIAECHIVKGNNKASASVVDMMLEKPLPPDTELIETFYTACVDDTYSGLQTLGFFGAMLVKSDLSGEELDEYYEQYRLYDKYFVVMEQKDTDFYANYVEHKFDRDFSDGNYYVIYTVSVHDRKNKLPFDYRGWY